MIGILFLVGLATQEPDLDPWLEKLRSGTIEEREEASQYLRRLGKGSVDRLRKALHDSQDAEFQARLREIVESLTTVQLDLVKTISFKTDRPERVVWRPDGRQVAVGGGEAKEIAVYDTESWEPVHRLETKVRPFDFAFSPSSGLFVVQTKEGIAVRATNSYEIVSSLRQEMGFRIESFFSPSVRFLRDDELVFGSSELLKNAVTTKVQRAERSKQSWKVEGIPLEDAFVSGRFHASPKGTLLIPDDVIGTLRILETERWKEIAKATLPDVEPEKERDGIAIGTLRVFSPRESFLAITGIDLYVTVYETKSWKEKRTWKPNGTPRSFGFTHDEKYLLTVGDDQTVRIWSCGSLEEVGSVRLPRSGLILPSPAANLVLIGYPEPQSRFVDVVERIEVYRVREP